MAQLPPLESPPAKVTEPLATAVKVPHSGVVPDFSIMIISPAAAVAVKSTPASTKVVVVPPASQVALKSIVPISASAVADELATSITISAVGNT